MWDILDVMDDLSGIDIMNMPSHHNTHRAKKPISAPDFRNLKVGDWVRFNEKAWAGNEVADRLRPHDLQITDLYVQDCTRPFVAARLWYQNEQQEFRTDIAEVHRV